MSHIAACTLAFILLFAWAPLHAATSACFGPNHQAPPVSGDRYVPYPYKCKSPRFPRGIRDKNGWCIVEFAVGADGKPYDVKALKWSSSKFRRPAIKAMKKWRFAPATRNGQPISVEGMTMRFRFSYEFKQLY